MTRRCQLGRPNDHRGVRRVAHLSFEQPQDGVSEVLMRPVVFVERSDTPTGQRPQLPRGRREIAVSHHSTKIECAAPLCARAET